MNTADKNQRPAKEDKRAAALRDNLRKRKEKKKLANNLESKKDDAKS